MSRFPGRVLVISMGAIVLTGVGCAAMAYKSSAPDNGGGWDAGSGSSYTCFSDANCPSGLTCVQQQCVTSDGLPPEQTNNSVFVQPQTSSHYVFALSPTENTVSIIDPTTLAIRSVSLPQEPLGMAVIPGKDAALIVEHAGKSVSYLSCNATTCNLHNQPTARHYPSVSVSQDGQWAVLWTPDPQTPDQGAEGIVGIVNVAGLAAGTPEPIVERATGRRDRNAFFRTDSGAAVDAVIVGQDGVAIVDLASLDTQPLPQIVALPAEFTDVDSRQTVVSPDGKSLLLRSFSSQNVGVLDISTRTIQSLAMTGTPSDIELSYNGSMAVAVLRDTGQISYFPLPDVLSDSALIKTVSAVLPATDCAANADSCTASAGQAVLSSDGSLAVLFTNATPTMSFATLDLTSGAVSVFSDLEKLVQTLGIGPDGHSVIVLHKPDNAANATDSYQQMVNASQGYSVVNLSAGLAELNLTGKVSPQAFVFTSDGQHAGVTLTDGSSNYQVASIDLQTLVTTSLALASPPQFTGPFGGSDSLIWVAQNKADGRISFLDTTSNSLRTVTGYALNSGIAP